MILRDDNFLLYAIKNYDVKNYTNVDDFYSDLKRIQYVKKLFKKYQDSKELRTRLIMNHLIILFNCFGPASVDMLFLKLKEYRSLLVPFLIYLSYMPEKITVNDETIHASDIYLNDDVIAKLRNFNSLGPSQ